MTTMTLIHTTEKKDDLLTMSDAALEAWFAEVGLPVHAMTNCASADCPVCFPKHSQDSIHQAA